MIAQHVINIQRMLQLDLLYTVPLANDIHTQPISTLTLPAALCVDTSRTHSIWMVYSRLTENLCVSQAFLPEH